MGILYEAADEWMGLKPHRLHGVHFRWCCTDPIDSDRISYQLSVIKYHAGTGDASLPLNLLMEK
ncbi:hypothetical protein [Scytonema sp. HK-05]|uniref:hypothetical protein n=1 Tax=Scytonema sp. HK-05 TaxID=1137095 RepID=UPI0009633155|nr:hypothetical protein NIES2130_02480 [Scytonema sp. HK-05]